MMAPAIITIHEAGFWAFGVTCSPRQKVVVEWLAAARWDPAAGAWLLPAGGRERLVADLEALSYRVKIVNRYSRIVYFTASAGARRHAQRVCRRAGSPAGRS